MRIDAEGNTFCHSLGYLLQVHVISSLSIQKYGELVDRHCEVDLNFVVLEIVMELHSNALELLRSEIPSLVFQSDKLVF